MPRDEFDANGNGYPDLLEHYSTVERYLSRHRPPDLDVHDLIQDTYLRAYTTMRSRGPPSKPVPWLITLARRSLASAYRIRTRVRQLRVAVLAHDTLEALLTDARDNPAFLAERLEAWTVLKAGLEGLEPKDKHLLIEHYINGRSRQELSVEFGTTEWVIRTRLYRARQRLRALLPPDEQPEE